MVDLKIRLPDGEVLACGSYFRHACTKISLFIYLFTYLFTY